MFDNLTPELQVIYDAYMNADKVLELGLREANKITDQRLRNCSETALLRLQDTNCVNGATALFSAGIGEGIITYGKIRVELAKAMAEAADHLY